MALLTRRPVSSLHASLNSTIVYFSVYRSYRAFFPAYDGAGDSESGVQTETAKLVGCLSAGSLDNGIELRRACGRRGR